MRVPFIFPILFLASAQVWCQPSGLEAAGQYQNKAASQLLNGDFEGAIGQLESAAALYESAQEWEHYFSCLNQITNVYLSLGRLDDAKRTAKKALWKSIQRLGRDNDEAAKAAHRLAEVYSRAGRHAKAIEVHEMGLMIRESIYGNRHARLANSYDWLARAWLAAADFGRAADFYGRALGMRQELLGAEHPDVAVSYTNLANLELARENYRQALAYFQAAYAISKGRLGNKHPDVASALASMARINHILGDEDLSARQYQEAAFLFWQNPESAGELAAEAFHQQAIRHFQDGNLDAAVDYCRRAVQALAEAPAQEPEQALLYQGSLGALLLEKGAYREAAAHFRQAMMTGERTSAVLYSQWVRALRLSGSLPEALDAATGFLEWSKRQADAYFMLEARLQVGGLLIEAGRIDEGIRQLTIVFNHADTPFRLLQEANQYLADAYLRQGNYDKAIQQYRLLASEWGQSRQPGASFFRFTALLSLGAAHSELAGQDRNTLYNLEAALDVFKDCDILLSRLAASPLPAGQLAYLSAALERLYGKAIKTCYSLYQQNQEERYLREAFRYSERSKRLGASLSLLQLPPSGFAGVPQSLLEREAACKRPAQLMSGTLMPNLFPAEAADSIRRELEKREAEYGKVLEVLRQQCPAYYQLKFDGEVAEPDEVNAFLQQYAATLYSYYIDEENLYVFYFTGQDFQLFWIPADGLFRNSLRRFLQMASSDPRKSLAEDPEAVYRQTTSLAVELYNKLLPGKPETAGPNVFLLPHGILQWLPFEALLPAASSGGDFSGLPYLGLSHNLYYHSSATALINGGRARPAYDYESSFEAFAPAGDQGSSPVAMKGAYHPERRDILRLSYFHSPIRALAAERGGRLWDDLRSGEQAYRSLPPTGVLLLALPARPGSSPENTFVLFSDEGDSLSDNRLYLKEVYGISKPVGLYIIASSSPRPVEDAGWQPLAEALRYSGCQSLLFHRWPAAGRPSAELLDLFFGRWQTGAGVPQTLKEARRAYLAQQAGKPERGHPFFWAGYLSYGQPERVPAAAGIPGFWIIGAVAGLVLIGWLVRMH
ncbi:MAG: tetratricopeptide repeat protein [Phaeodactylibacter sp.]|nr:tetratricopeptide repeat protein [Phaeodactylibacter sp.]